VLNGMKASARNGAKSPLPDPHPEERVFARLEG
jgi:hypothetical protein